MLRKWIALLVSLALLLTCLPALSENGVTVTDMMGREITLAAPADRIVALTAADCEILCALGAEETLVGRGEYCDYPASILDVPVVNSGAETNLEQILALAPQVVLMSGMAQSKEMVDALEKAGIVVVVSYAQDIAGTYQAISMIGALMGRNAQAEALTAQMRAAFDGIAAQAENTGKTVYFEVSPLEWGLYTAGKHTFMEELATLCGLTNAFADVEGWAPISEEQVLERNPDYIVTITMYYGEGPTPVEEIKGRKGWGELTAVQNDAIFNADSNEISRPGPRLMDAAQALYEFITTQAADAPAV